MGFATLAADAFPRALEPILAGYEETGRAMHARSEAPGQVEAAGGLFTQGSWL
jgi:hypothetical protein